MLHELDFYPFVAEYEPKRLHLETDSITFVVGTFLAVVTKDIY